MKKLATITALALTFATVGYLVYDRDRSHAGEQTDTAASGIAPSAQKVAAADEPGAPAVAVGSHAPGGAAAPAPVPAGAQTPSLPAGEFVPLDFQLNLVDADSVGVEQAASPQALAPFMAIPPMPSNPMPTVCSSSMSSGCPTNLIRRSLLPALANATPSLTAIPASTLHRSIIT